MKAKIVIFLVALCSCFCFIKGVRAEENTELKNQLNIMQKQIEGSKKRIEQLESIVPTGKISGPKCAASRELVEKFELGGEVSIQFVDTQNDNATSEPEPHLDLDKVSLMLAIQITEDIRFDAELEIEEGEANLDESYFIFSNLPLHSTLQIGKDDRFFKADRCTEKYPLAGNAFWRDEEIGISWKTEIKPFYTVLSWSNGLELSSRPSGEDESYEILHDNTKTGNYAGIRQVSGGLGFIGFLGKSAQIDILGWGLYNKLSYADIDFLKTNLNNYTSGNDDQHRFGLNLKLILAKFELGAQYIDAKDGKLDRAAWFVQPSYKIALPFGWKYFNEYRVLIRYGELEVDNPESFDKPFTWDREEITIALIAEICQNFKLKTEYTINDENTGKGNVDNNELLMRFEYEF